MIVKIALLGFLMFLAVSVPAVGAEDDLDRAAKRLEAGGYEAAAVYLKRCADDRDERCQYLLGVMKLSGQGVERDFAAASSLLRQAATAGLPIAQSNLGVLYASGEGVEKDVESAAELFRKSAEYGDRLGQAALGMASFLGEGIPQNRIDAYVWTSLAAFQGSEKALAVLPSIRDTLTDAELEEAKSQIASFRAKDSLMAKRSRRLQAQNALKRAGLERRTRPKTKR